MKWSQCVAAWLMCAWAAWANGVVAEPSTQKTPTVFDERLELSLIAEDPILRTPIGLAIDDDDRLYVLESHTHERPSDYDGPERDRVLCFVDSDDDGRYESVSVFAQDILMGMNLAFSPDGVLHVVSAKDVFALPDENSDGVCDGNRLIVRMKAGSNYAHNCMLGITFGHDGWMYLARGNVGSTPYEFEGPDDSRVEGYGDGGSILRCRADGTEIEEFATGFWNPIQVKFDRAGRLLCVDNDPDARGPNRLIHVVQGGDYGHRNMYGGSGNHPFQGWDGDLPGTLPYASGTGEAPCDLLDVTRTSFPTDFQDSILVTVWNENTIERHPIVEAGLSIRGEGTKLVQGGDDFRPVAIEANTAGDVFFTDWVLVDYPNHGRGRLWRLSATTEAKDTIKPRQAHASPIMTSGEERLKQIAELHVADEIEALRAALRSKDPFERHAAIQTLAAPENQEQIEVFSRDDDAAIRLASLLAVGCCDGEPAKWQLEITRRLLGDVDPVIRRAALIEVGTNRLASLRSDVDHVIQIGSVDETIFETYLACVECLDPAFIAAYESQKGGSAKKAPRRLDRGLLLRILADDQRSAAIRILALNRMETPLPTKAASIVDEWLDSSDHSLQMAAIARMADGFDTADQLMAIANDESRPIQVRCEALLAIQRVADAKPLELLSLIQNGSAEVAIQAARTFKEFAHHPDVRRAAKSGLPLAKDESIRQCFATILGESLRPITTGDRPKSIDDWKTALASGGDAAAGRRVFHSKTATCGNCHEIGGHKTTLGPNLGQIAQSVDRSQLIHSILRPSDQFAPQYQAWKVLTSDGHLHTGLQIDHQSGGDIDLILTDGKKQRFEAETIEEYMASTTSIMPSGLEQRLTTDEMRDLVAYLESLK